MSNKIKDLMKPQSNNKKGFDFDYWCNLAKDDPEAFESARKTEIEQHIGSIKCDSAQERMQRLQWRVEMERKLSKNPMESAIRIYDMMWESVGKNYSAFEELADLLKPENERTNASKKPDSTVLDFPQRKDSEEVTV